MTFKCTESDSWQFAGQMEQKQSTTRDMPHTRMHTKITIAKSSPLDPNQMTYLGQGKKFENKDIQHSEACKVQECQVWAIVP